MPGPQGYGGPAQLTISTHKLVRAGNIAAASRRLARNATRTLVALGVNPP
jgi:hypothetical protein